MNIGFGVCVGSWDKYSEYVQPNAEKADHRFLLDNQTSIAEAYNKILEDCQEVNLDLLVLQHDDFELLNFSDLELFHKKSLEDPDIAILGVAGAGNVKSLSWWEGNTVGHTMMDSGPITFPRLEGEVDVVDGMFMVLTPWTIANLRFDEKIVKGFHGYDCDIGLQALAAGKKNFVLDVDSWHHNITGFKTVEAHQSWLETGTHFKTKWFGQ